MGYDLILASKSQYRSALLTNAGLKFSSIAADIDERAVEAPLLKAGFGGADIAAVLAEAKAQKVADGLATDLKETIVIGCDQTLSLNREQLHKPASMEAARRNLLKLSGQAHQLNSAIVLIQNNKTIWRHVALAQMTMRELSPEFIGQYLAQTGDAALSSVGGYQIEGRGIQLFEKIEGDYFTIVGLPLLPFLAELRRMGAIDG